MGIINDEIMIMYYNYYTSMKLHCWDNSVQGTAPSVGKRVFAWVCLCARTGRWWVIQNLKKEFQNMTRKSFGSNTSCSLIVRRLIHLKVGSGIGAHNVPIAIGGMVMELPIVMNVPWNANIEIYTHSSNGITNLCCDHFILKLWKWWKWIIGLMFSF